MTPRGFTTTRPARTTAVIGARNAPRPKAQATAEPTNHPTKNQSGAATMRFMELMVDATRGRHNSPLVPGRLLRKPKPESHADVASSQYRKLNGKVQPRHFAESTISAEGERILSRRRPRRQDEHGQSLVEFALVFPIFVLLLAGMIQFGMIFWGQNTLNQLVRDTGRFAATLNCTPAAVSDSEDQFDDLLTSTGGPWINATRTVTYSSSTCPIDNSTAVFVNVTASFDAPVFFPWLPGNGHLTSVTDFRVEPTP